MQYHRFSLAEIKFSKKSQFTRISRERKNGAHLPPRPLPAPPPPGKKHTASKKLIKTLNTPVQEWPIAKPTTDMYIVTYLLIYLHSTMADAHKTNKIKN